MTTSNFVLKDTFLSKTNTTSYTPTANYHPATKKYVDDTAYWKVSDTAYASSWNWVTTVAPSKNAVYDKISAMDTTIGNKANTSDVLTKTNTTSYTPTANYHPATKKYVDDAVSQGSWWIQALPWSPIEIKYIWAWTQEQYDALSTYREDTIYHIV